jgi:thioredoxin reductase (NADPH)
MHRRDVFKADAKLVTRMREACAAGQLRLLIAQPQALVVQNGGLPLLTGLTVFNAEGQLLTVAADVVVARLGLSPKLGPIADWGLALEHKQLIVDPSSFQTNVPGIFAAGDINTYPGKRKLILCAFYEATMAAWAAQAWLRPDQPQLLQYTTTSSKLHRLLGVE